ncbi:hypothetical protein JVT61DRAFT_2872 [Boletus reticuloceps]|uniref:Uncharacterized protein n=1 Tax=Boletus reticuloceps TaxID=495285 RepID=A0A8I3A8N8_9AGAM|nr:hypothetical protein JVT61DRAFT_2872 [Boletus reticuloceps]
MIELEDIVVLDHEPDIFVDFSIGDGVVSSDLTDYTHHPDSEPVDSVSVWSFIKRCRKIRPFNSVQAKK